MEYKHRGTQERAREKEYLEIPTLPTQIIALGCSQFRGESRAISLGTHRPTHPPTRPSQTIRYVSFEQSKFDIASPRRQGWTKKDGSPVMG